MLSLDPTAVVVMSELRHSTREHHAPTEVYNPDTAGVQKRAGHKRKASVPRVEKKKTGTALKTTSAKGKRTGAASAKGKKTGAKTASAKKRKRSPSITPSPSRSRSPAKSSSTKGKAKSASSKRKPSASAKTKTKGTKRAASPAKSTSGKKKASSTKGSKKKQRTAIHNPRIAAIPNDATAADSVHNTPQHNPQTEAKRMSHYTPAELHQARHIEESYEAKGMGEKRSKAIAFATVNKLRAMHGETKTSSQ